MLVPLDIPPGVRKVDTAHAVSGRFIDCQWVRFVAGKPEKMGGWEPFIDEALEGVPRSAISWATAAGSYIIGAGTHLRLYAIIGGDTIVNITPIRDSGTLTDPFETESGSDIVTVTHTAHGLRVGDFVFFSGATAVGGITIDGEYRVVSRIDADTYTIEHSAAATSDATGGGSVDYEYEVSIGTVDGTYGLGYGAGTYGTGTYSTPRSGGGILFELRHWHLDDYGNDLLALPNGGNLYHWDSSTLDRAELIANSPTARAMFVTAERFIFLLGTTSPMTIQWPDRDDPTDWTPTAANTANIRTLQNGSKLIAGAALSDNVNLIWSDTALYLAQYTGSELIYDTRLVGESCGLLGPRAFAVSDAAAFWFSIDSFYMFADGLQPIPNVEDVLEFVLRDLNRDKVAKIAAGYNERFDEVWWIYPGQGAIEPNRYVAVSLRDYSWVTGSLSRTAMSGYRPADGNVVMFKSDGTVWRHEEGLDADGAAISAYLEYGLYVLDRAERNCDVWGFVPDMKRQAGDVELYVYTKDRPRSDVLDEATVTMAEDDEIADLALGGRHFGFRLTSNQIGGDFRLGIPSIEVAPTGSRR